MGADVGVGVRAGELEVAVAVSVWCVLLGVVVGVPVGAAADVGLQGLQQNLLTLHSTHALSR